jgi:TetR/AcrR family transcriptional regulator
MKVGVMRPAPKQRKSDRKREVILAAALELFSRTGVDGASLDRVAERADVSKTNLIYYYPSKDALYRAVLNNVLSLWLVPLEVIDPANPPEQAIASYVRQKIAFSRDQPAASRLFCFEILYGAPVLDSRLREMLRPVMEEKAKVFEHWIASDRMAKVDPYQFLYSLWATTQHFADFATQIEALSGRTLDDPAFFEESVDHVTQLFLARIKP